MNEKTARNFAEGARAALPIVAGYVPLGFACGVICAGVGMTVFETCLMSALVFAGAAQYVAAGMIGAGMSPAAIIITAFTLNLRHALYSSALYGHVRGWTPLRKAFFAWELTDETFAMHSSVMGEKGENFPRAVGINVTAHAGWIGGNFLGAFSGSLLVSSDKFGLDFALPALFIALLIPLLKGRPNVAAAFTAGLTALILAVAGVGGYVIFASVAGAAAGMIAGSREHGK